MSALTGREKIFYEDQKGSRECRLSEEIDTEYEDDKEEKQKENDAVNEFMNPVEYTEVIPIPSTPRHNHPLTPLSSNFTSPGNNNNNNNSLFDNVLSTPKSSTLESHKHSSDTFPRPEIRNYRKVKPQIKDAIATVSYRAAVSIDKARVAVKATCEKMYGHMYYLSPEEQAKFEPQLATIIEDPELQEEKRHTPKTKEDFKKYRYVLPSRESSTRYKHSKSISQEVIIANALANKSPETRVTLHFDTTKRSRVPGDWPSLILNFLSDTAEDCKLYPLRAILLTYETREQIADIIVESLNRLSVAGGDEKTARELWENIYAYMSDSVTKNIGVPEIVAEKLGSDHKPIHILCKSHVCEKMDECCIDTLAQIERKLNLGDQFIAKIPRLKSFVRSNKSIAVTAMDALLKLVSHEASGKTISLATEFDHILDEEGISKSFCLHEKRRFTRLGHTAGAIVDCLPQFKRVLEESSLNNLLAQACRMYIESDYIVAALRALANFTFKVTMPYVNCVEKTTQVELKGILFKLHTELRSGQLTTLDDFHVPWKHVHMDRQQPTSELDKYLLQQMCYNSADGIVMQCGREYWGDERAPRATELYKLADDQLKHIPSENMICERNLAKFGYLASISAVHSNKYFKANRIRDDLMFSEGDEGCGDADSKMKIIVRELDKLECKWVHSQKNALKEKIKSSLEKKKQYNQYINAVMAKCKEHGGPLVQLTELTELVKRNPSNLKSHLRNEIILRKSLYPSDVKERPELYKVNSLTLEDYILNMSILLESNVPEAEVESSVLVFHSDKEIMEMIHRDGAKNDALPTSIPTFTCVHQQPVAVVWDTAETRYWCIGFCIGDSNSEDIIRVDHLEKKG